jgi:hypothetical protein
MPHRLSIVSTQVSVKNTVNLLNNILILFQLGLEPVLYDERNSSSHTSYHVFNTTSQSDFELIELTCTVGDKQSSPCSNITVQSDNCSTTLNLIGTLGCDYMCFFTTKKTNYDNVNSTITSLTVCKYLSV